MDVRQRIDELLGRLRPGRDTSTGSVATGLLAMLAAVSIAAGIGAVGTTPRLANVGAWLASSAVGTVVHFNGLSGRADGRVALPNARHALRVVQDGAAAYVIDEVTGQVSRIDPAQLNVGQARDYGAADVLVVTGAGVAYVVDPAAGTVQRIDPNTLVKIGRAISLQAPLGEPVLDGQGTLWVPVLAAGQVVPVHDGGDGKPVTVGRPNDPLALTIAGGTPVVTDAATATIAALSPAGVQREVNLPSMLATTSPGGLLVPPATDGPVVPLLSPSSDAMVLVNMDRGSVTTVPLNASNQQLEAPQALGRRVYIPDQTTGTLIVYDAAAGRFDSPMQVTGHAGPLDAFIQGGQLWVNDEGSPAALVVNADGSAYAIGKYDTQVPGPRPAGPPVAAPPAAALPFIRTGAAPQPVVPRPPAAPATPAPPVPAPSVPPAPPGAPGMVSATSGPGYITVTFTRSTSGSPTGYVLLGAPAGATVQPAQVPAGGPYTFQVTGGSCGSPYTFQVAAQGAGGQVASLPTLPVQPCVAPGAPQGLQASPVEHGANLQWSAAASNGGPVTYDLTWSGGSRNGLTGTSFPVGSLTNFTTYAFRLIASNAAGSGPAATTTVSVASSPYTTTTYNNSVYVLNVRSGPSESDSSIHQIPPRTFSTVHVICQIQGGHVQDPGNAAEQGTIWDRVSDFGGGYISDIYVRTPQSVAGRYANLSDPPIWYCN